MNLLQFTKIILKNPLVREPNSGKFPTIIPNPGCIVRYGLVLGIILLFPVNIYAIENGLSISMLRGRKHAYIYKCTIPLRRFLIP